MHWQMECCGGLINDPIGYVQTDLLRNYNGDSMMGDFIDDAIYNYLNTDGVTVNDVDLFLNNAGGAIIVSSAPQ